MQCAREFMNVILTVIIHKVMLEVFYFHNSGVSSSLLKEDNNEPRN